MVDLRCAICRVQGDIVQAAIDGLIQFPVSKQAHPQLADMTFGP